MTTMVTELYDALRDAGASDEKARAAAEVLANYDDRFNRLERQIGDLDHKIDRAKTELQLDIAGVRADNPVQKWMLGAVFALLIPIFLKQFVH